MKVIDLYDNIIFVDDIAYIKKSIIYKNSGFIYFKSNREPLKISDYLGNNNYTKVVNYLKSLNDEIEDTPKEDKKIEKVNRGCIAGENLRNIDWHILDKIDEITDRLNGEDNVE